MNKEKAPRVERIYTYFDTQRFWADCGQIIKERGESWYGFSLAIGLPSLAGGVRSDNPRIDTLVPVAVATGVNLDAYIVHTKGSVQTSPATTFDGQRFFDHLDRVRQDMNMSWYGVYKATGTKYSSTFYATLRQLQFGNKPSSQILNDLATWAGLELDAYQNPFQSKKIPIGIIQSLQRLQQMIGKELRDLQDEGGEEPQ